MGTRLRPGGIRSWWSGCFPFATLRCAVAFHPANARRGKLRPGRYLFALPTPPLVNDFEGPQPGVDFRRIEFLSESIIDLQSELAAPAINQSIVVLIVSPRPARTRFPPWGVDKRVSPSVIGLQFSQLRPQGKILRALRTHHCFAPFRVVDREMPFDLRLAIRARNRVARFAVVQIAVDDYPAFAGQYNAMLCRMASTTQHLAKTRIILPRCMTSFILWMMNLEHATSVTSLTSMVDPFHASLPELMPSCIPV